MSLPPLCKLLIWTISPHPSFQLIHWCPLSKTPSNLWGEAPTRHNGDIQAQRFKELQSKREWKWFLRNGQQRSHVKYIPEIPRIQREWSASFNSRTPYRQTTRSSIGPGRIPTEHSCSARTLQHHPEQGQKEPTEPFRCRHEQIRSYRLLCRLYHKGKSKWLLRIMWTCANMFSPIARLCARLREHPPAWSLAAFRRWR